MFYIKLLIHELIHASVYLVLVLVLIKTFKPKVMPYKNILLGLVVTIFMDMDHLVDFFLYKGSLTFNLHEFLFLNFFELLGKTYLPLHAWEWVALLLLLYLVLKKKYQFILFIALGIFCQLLVDSLSYGFDWRVYFITYRYLHHFDQSIFYTLRG